MKREDIILMVNKYLSQAQAGQTIEMSKFDFKSKWFNLNEAKDINEFLKDITAIANTPGPDGFIVIGYNEKENIFIKSLFNDSKLKDLSDLSGLINKKVDRIFQFDVIDSSFEGNDISIIHIPPSFDKPHVIRNYQTFKDGVLKSEEQNKIFIRNNTTTKTASKYDLELMNWDRQNIIPDYQLYCSFHTSAFEWNMQVQSGILADIALYISLTIENSGRRPLAITDINLDLSFDPNPNAFSEWLKLRTAKEYKINPIVVKPRSLEVTKIHFKIDKYTNNVEATVVESDLQQYKKFFLIMPFKKMWARLVNGTELDCNLTVIN